MVIDWNKSAQEIINQVRAFGPSPGCITEYKGKNIKILKVKKIEKLTADKHFSTGNPKPGQIVQADKKGLVVSFCKNDSKKS